MALFTVCACDRGHAAAAADHHARATGDGRGRALERGRLNQFRPAVTYAVRWEGNSHERRTASWEPHVPEQAAIDANSTLSDEEMSQHRLRVAH